MNLTRGSIAIVGFPRWPLVDNHCARAFNTAPLEWLILGNHKWDTTILVDRTFQFRKEFLVVHILEIDVLIEQLDDRITWNTEGKINQGLITKDSTNRWGTYPCGSCPACCMAWYRFPLDRGNHAVSAVGCSPTGAAPLWMKRPSWIQLCDEDPSFPGPWPPVKHKHGCVKIMQTQREVENTMLPFQHIQCFSHGSESRCSSP